MKSLTNIAKSLFIQFRRFKLANTLNLVGLCIALISFFLFFTKVEEEVRYNGCFKDLEHMYRIEIKGKIFAEETDSMANLFAPLRYYTPKIPHVLEVGILESSSNIITIKNEGIKDGKNNTYQCHYNNGHAEYLKFFDIEIIDSIPSHKEGDILVPESFARFMFNDTKVSGRFVSWVLDGRNEKRRIAGVYKDFPNNCCVKNSFYQYGKNKDSDTCNNFIYHHFVRIDDNANVEKIETDILNIFKDLHKKGEIRFTDISSIKIKLRTIHEAHFSDIDDKEDNGNWTMTIMLFFSAILAIVLTNVNYINLTLAMAPMRIRNLNTRRVLGASRASLITELMGESVLLTTIAFLISMAVLFALHELLPGNITPIHHLRITAYTFGISLWIGLLSSAYPAWYSTSFTPSIAIKGTFGLTPTSRRFRTIRISFQIVVCIVTTTLITALFFQQRFIFHSDEYGYDTEHILYGTLKSKEAMKHKEDIRKDIMKIDGVESVSFSKFEIGSDDRYLMWSIRTEDKKYNLFSSVLPIDKEYFKTMGIELTEGSIDDLPTDSGAFILNEAAQKKYKWLKVGGSILPYDNDYETRHKVRAFSRNVVFNSLRLHNDENPLLFYIPGKGDLYDNSLCTINIRIKEGTNINSVCYKIESVYGNYSGTSLSGNDLNLRRSGESLDRLYHVEMNFLMLMSIIATIFMAITLIGVFCITLFECEYRKKEIGIRKVFGATTLQIMKIFVQKYFLITLFSLVVSLPLSYILVTKLMSRFTLHSEYVNLSYPIAFVIVALAVLGTVSIECYRAAKTKVENR